MANSGNHSFNWMLLASLTLIFIGIMILVGEPSTDEDKAQTEDEVISIEAPSKVEEQDNPTQVEEALEQKLSEAAEQLDQFDDNNPPVNNSTTEDNKIAQGQVSEPDGYINGHGYVDLGLPSGLKWATVNVGSDSVQEYGDNFAWGQIKPNDPNESKKSRSWQSLKYKDVAWLMKKGYIGKNGTLTIQHDAARQNLGGTWRMPTKAEMVELINMINTTATWGTLNGVEGCFVKSKANGKTIFLPATGRRTNRYSEPEAYGEYWTSTPDLKDSEFSYYMYFGILEILPEDIPLKDPDGRYGLKPGKRLRIDMNVDSRNACFPIRAVSE